MNIPYYTEVYHTCDHNCNDHKIKTSYVLDTSKITSIVDVLGELRYLIKLESELIDVNAEHQIPAYKVLVSKPLNNTNISDIANTLDDTVDDNLQTNTQIEEVILDIYPASGYEFNYVKTQKVFDEFVKKYQTLVDAEMCDYSDMSVYRERINYKTTLPKCCGTCKWCRKSSKYNKCKSSKHHKFECHNPKNQQIFNYMIDCPDIKTKHKNCHQPKKSAWNHLPWQKTCGDQTINRGYNIPLNPLFPGVDVFGVCDGYEVKPSK